MAEKSSSSSLTEEVGEFAETLLHRDSRAKRDEPREVFAGFVVNRNPVGAAGKGDGSPGGWLRAGCFGTTVHWSS